MYQGMAKYAVPGTANMLQGLVNAIKIIRLIGRPCRLPPKKPAQGLPPKAKRAKTTTTKVTA